MAYYVVTFVVVITVSLLLRNRNTKKTEAVLKEAGQKVEEFKVGRIHGFVDDTNKMYVQEASLSRVNVIDLNQVKEYGFYQSRSDFNKYAIFMEDNQKRVGEVLTFATSNQCQQFYELAKKYAPELKNVGKVHHITYKPL